MRRYAALLIGFSVLVQAPGASLTQPLETGGKTASSPGPIAFLQARDLQAKKLLAQAPGDSLSPQLRTRIKDHINEVFDFAELSRLTLGDYWEARTPAERTHFIETFSAIIQEQNFDNFVRYYREGKIDYQSEVVESGKARVQAQVPLKREQIAIEYLLCTVEGQWRIYDLVIDGVSTAEGNRRRYARYIEKNSYEKLIDQLDKQLTHLRQTNG